MEFARLRTPMDVLGMFIRRFGLLVAVSVAVFAAVCGYIVTRVPLYSSTSQIAVDVDSAAPKSAAPGVDTQVGAVEAQIRLVQSPEIAAAVVDQLNLATNPEWNRPTPTSRTEARVHAIRAVMERVTVARDDVAPLILITATSRDPQLAAGIVNAMAHTYLAMGQESERASAAARANVLDKELDKAAQAFSAATARLAQYRATHGLTGSAATGSAVDQQAAATATELAAAQSEQDKATAAAAAARSLAARGQGDSVVQVIDSPVIADLKRKQADLASQAAEMSVRYGPNHPKRKQVMEQLAQIQNQLRTEESRVATSLTSAADAASSRAHALAGALSALRGQQAAATRATGEAETLQQIVETQREAYTNMAALQARAAQLSKIAFSPARLLMPGAVPTVPSYPKTALLLGLGIIAAPAVGILVLLLVEAFDSRIRRPEEITALPGVRHLSSVALLPRKTLRKIDRDARPWDYVLARPMSSFTESIRSIRLRLIASSTRGVGLVVCVTSAVSHEGKSTLSASLARTMALAGDRVLLIDCDLRRTGLAGLLEARPEAGLTEVLDGSRTFAETVVHDAAPGLDVLPLVEPRFTPRDVFGDGRMRKLLDRLRPGYAFIIVDAPPVLVVDDAAVLAGLADRVLLAVRWGSTKIEALRIAVTRLREIAEGAIGIVLTGVDPRASATAGYRDAHYYMMTAHGYHLN